MNEDTPFYEIFPVSLLRDGEEVCGDQVKVLRTAEKTLVVLSDGLGSGIKAAILARLTTEIIVTMLRESAPLPEVIATVVDTLPTCRVRRLAYATFAILEITHANGQFRLVSFDCPPPVLLKNRQALRLGTREENLGGKSLALSQGVMEPGDFLGLLSDGVLFADRGLTMNPAWNWNAVADCLMSTSQGGRRSARNLVEAVMNETRRRYGERVGDDATFVGVLARKPRRLVVFTGPPANKTMDDAVVEQFLAFHGRHVVCGGTTANLAAEHVGEIIHTEDTTTRDGIPPVAVLEDVDLVTEGILTMARALDLLKTSKGDPHELPCDRNGAVLLSHELLEADSILFLAGESVNPYYQNPQLPRSISIRRSLVTQFADLLRGFNKVVDVEWR